MNDTDTTTSVPERTRLVRRDVGYNSIDIADEEQARFGHVERVHVSIDNLNVWATQSKLASCFGAPSGSSITDERASGGRVHILQSISASVAPGELLAILGSSGSGKTTLLNTLAGRVGADRGGFICEGDVLFNGRRANIESIKRSVGYVMQADYLLPAMTVLETLTYAGRLRLPASMSDEQKRVKIMQVLRCLGLVDCLHTRVGGDGQQSISGGERRRVSIGVQMLTDPSVMFLDEPTSGLDSFTANVLMQTLLDIANSNRVVICTVHQPRPEILRMFSKVLLLSRGQVVYFGPPARLTSYFDALGFPCPEHVNPADYLLDVISIDPRSDAALESSKARLKYLTDAYRQSPEYRQTVEQVSSTRVAEDREFDRVGASRVNTVPTYRAMAILSSRAYVNLMRTPVSIITRIMQLMAFAFVLSVCYLRVGTDQIGIQNKQGFLYECLAVVFIGLLNAVAMFPVERNLFYRERSDGLYSTAAFCVSYMAIEVPFDLLTSLMYSIVTYVVIGLNPIFARFFVYWLVIFLLVFSGESVGLFLCSIFFDIGLANTIAMVFLSLCLLMAGFFRSISTLPLVLRYLNYGLITAPISQVLVINEFYGESGFTCPGSQALPNGQCPYSTGQQVIDALNFNVDTFWYAVGLACALAAFYRLVAFVLLAFKPIPPPL